MELLDLATQSLAIPVGAGILLNGVEEISMDAQYFLRGLHRRDRRAITPDELAAAPPKRIAIMVPAWHEAEVIEHMLEHNRQSVDYDPALYDFYCGTYQNDRETQACVAAVARRHANVHQVVVPHDGPTSKADCLNWIYQGIVLDEQRRGQRYDILLMHDAEDVIHPLAFKLYALLVGDHDFVQTPVFSLPLSHRAVVAATYIDEFAEHHLKELSVRDAFHGLVPSAGVGSAFARDAFEEIALAHDQLPFHVGSLTEDYEVGLKFRLAGKRVHFACRALRRERVVPRRFLPGTKRVVDEEYIATREYFPSGFMASVRQRARWITGIALQTWRDIGWQGDRRVRYCLWRDRKAVATNALLLGAWLVLLLLCARLAFSTASMSELVPDDSPMWWLLAINLGLLGWRALMKSHFVGHLYGTAHAVLSIPRMIVANAIGLLATARAVRQYRHHLRTKQPLRWVKTAHAFPSSEILAAQQKRLGEFLVARGQLEAADVDRALALQAGTNLRLGEVLAASGMMKPREVVRALGEHLAMATADPSPDEIPLSLLQRLPETVALALEGVPVAETSDGVVVAMTHAPTAGELQCLEQLAGTKVRCVLGEPEAIRRARWRAYRRLAEVPHIKRVRLGEALLARGELDLAHLDSALEEQAETGERLGELLVRHGVVGPPAIARALGLPVAAYRSISPHEVDRLALRQIGYGLASFYQVVPIVEHGTLVIACPFIVHELVRAEIRRRTGTQQLTCVLAAGLEVRIALALASQAAWPPGVAVLVPGLDGEELAELAEEPGARPLDLALQPESATRTPGALLPPELVEEHGIRICTDHGGLVFAAPKPTAILAHQVAELFVDRAVAWRVLTPAEGGSSTNHTEVFHE